MKHCLFLPVLVLTCATAWAQTPQPTLNEFTNETQFTSTDGDRMDLIWWLPPEYWDVVLSGKSSTDEIDQIKRVLDPYLVIGAVDGTIGPFGGVTFVPEQELREQLRVTDAQGVVHTPLPQKDISADARNLLGIVKPALIGTLGPMGENLHFFLFPAQDEAGGAIASAQDDGVFEIALGERTFNVRLPLGSLMPKKQCPVDQEWLNGAWTYCPWHGAKLEAVEVSQEDP